MTQKMTITNSSKCTFFDCPYKYFLSYVMLLSTDNEPEYFTWGKMIHRYAEDEENGLTYKDTTEAIRREVETGHSDWLGADIHRIEMMLTTAPYTMGAHYLRYPNDGVEYEDLGIEHKFSMKIVMDNNGDLILNFRGKIDKVVRYTKTGTIFNWERKTASKTGDSYWHGLQFASQPQGYLLATQKEHGYDTRRAIYDIFKKPQVRQGGQTDEQFAENLGKLYMLERAKYFERSEISFEQWEIDNYEDELKMSAKMIDWCTQRGCWPKHHPQNRIGHCEFESICKLDMNKGIPPGFRIRPLEQKHPELMGV